LALWVLALAFIVLLAGLLTSIAYARRGGHIGAWWVIGALWLVGTGVVVGTLFEPTPDRDSDEVCRSRRCASGIMPR
jgi:hypothetical protein